MTLDRLRAFNAVVFDMDGVILDSEPLHLAAMNRVLSEEGHSVTHEQNLQFVGATVEGTWTELTRMFALREAAEHYHGRFTNAILAVLGETPLEPFPGVLDFLDAVKRAERPLALATQSRPAWVSATLEGLGMADVFPVIVTRDEVAHGKPAPDIYLRACELLSADPAAALALEDSLLGARSARTAGMTVVGIRNVYAGAALADEADLVVDRLDELLDPAGPWPVKRVGQTARGDSGDPRS